MICLGGDLTVWFITGASRGLGAEIARQALECGDSVSVTARDVRGVMARFEQYGSRVPMSELDVTKEEEVDRAVAATLDRFGRIDVLMNNAGRGLIGAVEEADAKEVLAAFDTNVFGMLAVARGVLPIMRRQCAGRVLNVSSIGGFAKAPGWGIYGATKFAVEGISEALHGELAPLGIDVLIVEPGSFRTDFLDGRSLQRAARTIDDYADTAGRVRDYVGCAITTR